MSLQKRYLELLRKALVNELYLENDARVLYVFSSLQAGRGLEGDVLRNIAARRPELVAQLAKDREEGSPWWNVPIPQKDGGEQIMSLRNFCDFTHSMIGTRRMRNIEECLDAVREAGVPGDLAETGVWRGGATVFMRGYLAAYGITDRLVWAADSFEGLPRPSHDEDRGFDFSASVAPILSVSLEEVRALFARYGLLDEQVRFLKGWFKDTLGTAPISSLALLRVDGDLYESTIDSLVALYDKVSDGGFVLVDDYGDFPPCRKAVDDFRRDRAITSPIVAVDWSGVYWRK
jgi:O-methyltransferase